MFLSGSVIIIIVMQLFFVCVQGEHNYIFMQLIVK